MAFDEGLLNFILHCGIEYRILDAAVEVLVFQIDIEHLEALVTKRELGVHYLDVLPNVEWSQILISSLFDFELEVVLRLHEVFEENLADFVSGDERHKIGHEVVSCLLTYIIGVKNTMQDDLQAFG